MSAGLGSGEARVTSHVRFAQMNEGTSSTLALVCC